MLIAARISSKSIIQSQFSDQKQWFRWFCRFYFSKVLRLAQIKFIQWAIPPFFCSSNYLNRYKMQISRFWFSYMLQANLIILLNTVDRFNRIGFLDIVTNSLVWFTMPAFMRFFGFFPANGTFEQNWLRINSIPITQAGYMFIGIHSRSWIIGWHILAGTWNEVTKWKWADEYESEQFWRWQIATERQE